ncbi:MAG: hypothetical protein ACOX6O_00855 [Christensenellales bacterium]
MNDERTLAAINLHAILRNLEDLCQLDEDARALLKGHELKIGMRVPGLDPLTLEVKDGCLSARRGGEPGGLRLQFFSPAHLNGMVSGVKMPLPTGGFSHLRFLKNNFAALAKDLEKYLRPSRENLTDPAFLDKNIRLTAAAALYAVSEVANHDPLGQKISLAMGEGNVRLEVPGVLAYTIQAKDGKLTTIKGKQLPAQAFMTFGSLDILGQVLRGEIDSYLCIGRGEIAVGGRISMVDNLNKLLRVVSAYLT